MGISHRLLCDVLLDLMYRLSGRRHILKRHRNISTEHVFLSVADSAQDWGCLGDSTWRERTGRA